ncbi:hypothetical protein K439DRAFT_1616237 [Ramaria rubella]|nr:hypothetical protein K439DRAFT_1616237 [Ramaria rubella]
MQFQIHFIHGGLALIHSADGKMARAALLEEVIDSAQGDFCKFIHNGAATPLPPTSDPDYTLYVLSKTGGLTFLSNLQGGDDLLSDPQIMTHLVNVSAAFCAFLDEHECNHFCMHFGLLPPEPYQEELST